MASRWGIWAMTLGVGVMLVGCGSQTTVSQAKSPTTKASTPKTVALVKLATAQVGGKSESVLVNQAGETLYYFTKDSPSQSHCTGSCSALWPAALASSTKITQVTGAPGKLSVVKDAHGEQLAYQGHLLYTFSGDKKPGQAKGQGFLKEWWVATPSLKAAGGTSGGSGW